jgi:putative transposase
MTSRSHKIRLYPNKEQAIQLSKTAGTARFAYNWSIDICEEAYKNGEKHPSGYDLRKLWVSNHPEWADEVAASCIYKSCLNVDAAYKAFFQKRSKHPKHHKKGVHDSFYVAGDKGRVVNKKVRIPGVGYVRMSEALRFDDYKVNSYVISKKADKWYVSIQCDIPDERRTESESVVGVDVGCKHWAVASDGTVCKSPSSLKDYERRLKRKQRLLARKQKGSNRRVKAKLQVQKAYQKIQNTKLDTIHKFTSTIAKNHGLVVVEDLSVKDMQESDNKHIRKGVQNSAMSEIIRQLKYKCNNHLVVDRFYPSSKTCSNCGNVKEDLTLSDRTYQCRSCGFTIDRDMNAALNLQKQGLEFIYGRSDR